MITDDIQIPVRIDLARPGEARQVIIRPVPSDRRAEARQLVDSVIEGVYHPVSLHLAGEVRRQAHGHIERDGGRCYLNLWDDEGRNLLSVYNAEDEPAAELLAALMAHLHAHQGAPCNA